VRLASWFCKLQEQIMQNLHWRFLLLAGALACAPASAQQASPQPFKQPAYGVSITFEQAKVVAAAAVREAEGHHWPSSIAVVGTTGDLMFFEHMDNTSLLQLICPFTRRGPRPGSEVQPGGLPNGSLRG
jgi:hypothetical protein